MAKDFHQRNPVPKPNGTPVMTSLWQPVALQTTMCFSMERHRWIGTVWRILIRQKAEDRGNFMACTDQHTLVAPSVMRTGENHRHR
jgi:hypothetical protein